jgi:hypothetical protein
MRACARGKRLLLLLLRRPRRKRRQWRQWRQRRQRRQWRQSGRQRRRCGSACASLALALLAAERARGGGKTARRAPRHGQVAQGGQGARAGAGAGASCARPCRARRRGRWRAGGGQGRRRQAPRGARAAARGQQPEPQRRGGRVRASPVRQLVSQPSWRGPCGRGAQPSPSGSSRRLSMRRAADWAAGSAPRAATGERLPRQRRAGPLVQARAARLGPASRRRGQQRVRAPARRGGTVASRTRR